MTADQNLPLVTSDAAAHRKGADWKFALLGGLSSPEAPRVFTAAALHRFVCTYRPEASASTARLVSNTLVAAGALHRVSSGIFLNRRVVPSAELNEAASYLRSGAIISLHSVLGACGFLNNPSALVVAVLPTSTSKRPRLGDLRTSTGDVFRFYGVAEKFFPKTDDERWETLQPGRVCATFRPEAALLQWLHLASMQRSTLTMPPVDVDMEQLDVALLEKLADRWALTRQLSEWMNRAQSARFGEEADPQKEVKPFAPTQGALDEAASARARLMARKPRT